MQKLWQELRFHWLCRRQCEAELDTEIRCYFDKVVRDSLARSDALNDAGECVARMH